MTKSSIGLNTISELALKALSEWHEEHHPEEYKTTMPPINLYNIGPSHMKTTRSEILTEADKIVNGARADQYGGPEDSFQKIASLWTAYLSSMDEEVNISASDVACMMTLLKIARLCNSPDHRDSWVDVAGYAACGAEVASPRYRDMFESQGIKDLDAYEQLQNEEVNPLDEVDMYLTFAKPEKAIEILEAALQKNPSNCVLERKLAELRGKLRDEYAQAAMESSCFWDEEPEEEVNIPPWDHRALYAVVSKWK